MDRLTNLLDSFIKDYAVPFNDCIVYHKGNEVYRHKNGFSDYAQTQKISGNEKYNLYSCSKPITCSAALTLYEKGDITLDEPLHTFIPEFKNMYVKTEDGIKKAENPIRIRDLFTMEAGFNYNLGAPCLKDAKKNTGGKCPTVETVKYLSEVPLDFEPGTMHCYSLCHDVLAAVVEVVSKRRFGLYVKESIFDKLGMTHSTYWKGDFELSDICAQYKYNSETKMAENCGTDCVYRLGELYESGGAGCVSTVSDYVKFMEGLRTGAVLQEETLSMMTTNQLTGKALEYYRSDAAFRNYGYGLGVRCPFPGTSVTDFGWDGAAGAYMAIDVENEITFYYAQQLLNAPNWDVRPQLVTCIKEILK